MIVLPEKFEEKMRMVLGEEYEEFLASYDQPRNFGLRVNVDKISPEEFERIAPFHLTRIPWTENGYYRNNNYSTSLGVKTEQEKQEEQTACITR